MILHVDMDAIYASIEQRDRPELIGRPVIVGGSPEGRGVVAAASYAVRTFGVHSAMPVRTALQLCPQAIVLPVRMTHYAAVSRQIREIFFRYTPLVEPLSLDEAFLDVSGCEPLFGPAEQIARSIKRQIWEETQLVASVGVAPNKFLAKIASDLEKPDALVVVDPERILEFLQPLPVNRLWGVGKVTDRSMQRFGVRTIGDLRTLSLDTLRQIFGDTGEHFWRLARGLDDRPVVPDRVAKSISHETTFATDIDETDTLRACLLELTEQVARRLRRHQHQGRTVQLKLRYADFRTITRSRTLSRPTDSTEELWQAASDLLSAAWSPAPGNPRSAVRLLGMGISGFVAERPVQRLLFDDPDEELHAKQQRLDRVADAVRDRFGATSLKRGGTLQPGKRDEHAG
jgi:DNA polymerase-4